MTKYTREDRKEFKDQINSKRLSHCSAYGGCMSISENIWEYSGFISTAVTYQ